MPNMHQLLVALVEKKATELVITTGSPPQLRLDGELVPLRTDPLTPITSKELVWSVLTEEQAASVHKGQSVRMSFGVRELSRFRMVVYTQRGATAAVLSAVPFKVPALDPALSALERWASLETPGVYVFSGLPRAGKSLAQAAVLDAINSAKHVHLITLEQPIEALHPHKNSIVEQLEVGVDVPDFEKGAQTAIWAGADVIAFDAEPAPLNAVAFAAERGRFVFTTLTAQDAEDATEVIAAHARLRPHVVGHAHLMRARGAVSVQLLSRGV